MVTESIRDNDWGEWENHSQKLRDNPDIAPAGTVGFYANNFCSVQIKPVRAKLGKNLALRLGIRLHDQSTRIGWAEKQRIKNTLIGEDRIAIEVYPKESELVDQANMFWLWVLPKDTDLSDFGLPFNL